MAHSTNDRHPPQEPKTSSIGHNSGTTLRTGIQTVSIDMVDIWGPAEDLADDCDVMALDDTVAAIAAGLQRAPVPVRITNSGGCEAVAKAHLVKAVRLHNERHPATPAELEVRVFREQSDEDAFRLLAQDVEQDFAPSSHARGLFFARVVAEFGSVESAAKICRVSKAAVSKNIDVARCLPIVGAKVQVHRDISQRDATWLMQQIGREKTADNATVAKSRDVVKTAVENMEIMPAKKVFAALRLVLKSDEPAKPRRNTFPVRIDGRTIGFVHPKTNDRIAIELAGAGDIPVDDLMAHLGAIVADIRKA